MKKWDGSNQMKTNQILDKSTHHHRVWILQIIDYLYRKTHPWICLALTRQKMKKSKMKVRWESKIKVLRASWVRWLHASTSSKTIPCQTDPKLSFWAKMKKIRNCWSSRKSICVCLPEEINSRAEKCVWFKWKEIQIWIRWKWKLSLRSSRWWVPTNNEKLKMIVT